ncbi:MAG: hypothetical protein WC632_05060 [Candidatus Margulisiibacteriota bacterium]
MGLIVALSVEGDKSNPQSSPPTGSKLLTHASSNPETLATGYPLTVLAGTAWAYLLPIVIIGILLMVTFKEHGK